MNSKSSSVSRLRNSGLQRSLTAATAIGGASSCLMTANAAIVKSGSQNLSTSILIGDEITDDVEVVNVDFSGGHEFALHSFGTKGSDFHLLMEASPDFEAIVGPDFYVSNLAQGALIDGAGNFQGGSGGFGYLATFVDNQTDFSPPESVVWNFGSDGYIGFRFNPSGSQQLYGWGHVTISADRTVLTLVDWAYENTGAPIHAGEIPEPTTSLLLTGGLFFSALWRRLRGK